MRRNLAISLLSCFAVTTGCVAADQVPIVEFDDGQSLSRSERQELRANSNHRWSITVYEGYGPPGSDDADVVVPNAMELLQSVVDDCRLGATTYFRHTDGVASLEIEDEAISVDKIDCIRRYERPGLSLEKPRLRTEANSMESVG